MPGGPNFDLPWNPMRLVQRHGRIDRIGSHHREVFLRCIFPDRQLDDLLGLEERLHRKIKQAAASIGVGGEVLPGSQTSEIVFTETREEIERLRAEDATLFEESGRGRQALSGEDYRQQLRQAMEDPDLNRRIRSLPWGSGSGMAVFGQSPGYVFCARVADHPRRQFRYVEVTDPHNPIVIRDTLTCLDHARPPLGFETARVLSQIDYDGAFDAWGEAHDDIVRQWNIASDPANLVAPIPLAMQRAADLIRSNKPTSMTTEEADRIVEALEAPYPERVLKLIRTAMALDTPADQVAGIIHVVEDLGLEASPAPEALPEIDHDDVHLICWLAIVPEIPLTIAEQIGQFPLGDTL